jgi:hypothetical protein
MIRVVVLFNLKPGVEPATYENWVNQTELQIVRGLTSVSNYSVHATTGLFGAEGVAPYAYVELLDIGDMQRFGEDVSTETMQTIVEAFGTFAQAPVFMLTREVESAS